MESTLVNCLIYANMTRYLDPCVPGTEEEILQTPMQVGPVVLVAIRVLT